MADPMLTERRPDDASAAAGDPSGPGDAWRALIGEFLGFGGEAHLEAPGQPYADALSKEERQRVRSAVLRGRPAWDEPSAQYAVVVARSAERAHPFGVVASTVFLGAFAIGMTAGTVALILDGDFLALFPGVFALLFWPSALWLPFAARAVRQAPRLNARLLPDGFAIPAVTPAPRGNRALRLVGKLVGGALVFGVARMGLLEVLSGDESTSQAFASGAITGVLFVGCGEAFRAFGRWRQSR